MPEILLPYGNYLIHLLSSFALVAVFSVVYTFITPFDELALIRKGGAAAALSLSGALIGFSITVASSIMHNDSYTTFLVWAGASALVQILTFAVLSRVIPSLNDDLNNNNVAMGGLMGAVSLMVGILNAACLS